MLDFALVSRNGIRCSLAIWHTQQSFTGLPGARSETSGPNF